jgi:hypothetical protein
MRVFDWSGGAAVPSRLSTTTSAGGQEPGGAVRQGYAQIQVTIDPALDGSPWYAIALPTQASAYRLNGEAALFTFADGTRGVRFSPAHAPLVALVVVCQKDGGTVAAYAHFSESVNAVGTLEFDHGATAAPCAVGDEQPAVTQFICANATGTGTFALRIADGVTAQASGAAMAATTLRSADMETWSTNDGCSYYRPALAN